MQLTLHEEGDLLLRYTPMAKRLIRDYCAACGLNVRSLGDDLLQEAYIELLLQIRKAGSEREIPLAKLNMLGAICTALRRMQSITLPKHAYKKLRNEYRDEPYESLDIMDFAAEGDLLFTVAFSSFVDSLTTQERFVLIKKLEGHSHRELVSHFGLQNEMAISRVYGRLKEALWTLLME